MFQITADRILAGIIVLCTAIPVHEYAHAWMADRMGDPTARYRKRLSLNPLDHVDPIGALMIVFLGFGFAKAVPINSFNFRDRKKGIVLTSLAGPASNILMALCFMALYKLLRLIGVLGLLPGLLIGILFYIIMINLSLAVFNLIPLPPLDGWHAISQVLPPSVYWKIVPYEQYLMWGVMMLAVLGVLSPLISFFVGILLNLLNLLTLFLGRM